MIENKRAGRRSVMSLSVSLCALVGVVQAYPSAAFAQEAAPKAGRSKDTVSSAKPTSPNATINLVNMLVQQGVLKEEQAQNLIKQAEDEAYVARQAAKDATAKADEASKAANAATSAASPPGSKRVTYVPEMVKKQLRDEIRAEVMTQARDQNWASPGAYPEWASRIRFYGDLRGRYEAQMFPHGGYNAPGSYINFNTINTGSPLDIGQPQPFPIPTYNSDQDRERFRLRARLGLDVNLFDGFTAGMRIGTGDSNSPVSTNQTLGASGGNFSKYSLWLDRGFMRYQPVEDVAVSVGRFDNPFFSATDLVWHSDLGFDGAAVQVKHEVLPGLTPFFNGGGFPVFNTDLNLASSEPLKFKSDDKYLFGAQFGLNAKFYQNFEWTFAVSYFNFTNVQGKLSTPCDLTYATACNTDARRPSFAQKGNTYMRLRDIVPTLANPSANPQYFGLAGEYQPVVVSSRLDLAHFSPVHVILDGEYVWNSAFNRDAFAAVAENNFAGTPDGTLGPYAGGNMGWMARLTVGDKKLAQFGDWRVHVAYKYLESDATIDAFTDSDFGLGGTNLKGFIVGGNLALSQSVSTSVRWLSANAIAGAPYAVDIVQLDLNAKF